MEEKLPFSLLTSTHRSPDSPMKPLFKKITLDTLCFLSLVGIWPRFFAPYNLSTNHYDLSIRNLPKQLVGTTILQFSDLHICNDVPKKYLQEILRTIQQLKPDIIVFTGDFLCYSSLECPERLQHFLSSIHAPHGCFAILGNHDYSSSVNLSREGVYEVANLAEQPLLEKLSRFFRNSPLPRRISADAEKIPVHRLLNGILKRSPFTLLHNEHQLIPIKGSFLNLCGVGEYTLGKTDPETTFQSYDNSYPGIILAHNPDAIPILQDYPGDVILCGHTHGAQINLPWIRERITCIEQTRFIKGLHKENGKWIYINKGLGSSFQFRFRSSPELSVFKLLDNISHSL